ncbi:MAG: hypothetical protein ACXWKM_14430 [Phenylobacterium sp.]
MDGGDFGRPVFVHGMWRSGSTFVWSRFRAAPGALSYYEPLHDGLARLSRGRLRRNGGYDSVALGHGPLERPYFAEFEALLGLVGVRRYRRSFAFDHIVLEPDEPHPGLQRYVAGLIDHARARGLLPVLACNRTCLRVAWLQRRFDAAHVYLQRSPEGLAASYIDQRARGNPWFIANWLWVIERNATHPLFEPLAGRLPLRRGAERVLKGREAFYLDAARRMSPAEVYAMTTHLWLACAAHGARHVDLVLDMERMVEPRYCAQATLSLRSLTGLRVRFDGARPMSREVGLAPSSLARIRREVEAEFPGSTVVEPCRWSNAKARRPHPAAQPVSAGAV